MFHSIHCLLLMNDDVFKFSLFMNLFLQIIVSCSLDLRQAASN